MSLDVDAQFDERSLKSINHVLSYKDRDIKLLLHQGIVRLLQEVGYLLTLRMREAVTESQLPVKTLSLLLRQNPDGGDPLHDTGLLARVLSFNVVRLPGRTFLEVGPLGKTRSILEAGLDAISADTPVDKLSNSPAETISYQELAWIHELGAVVPVTEAMVRLFYSLAVIPGSDVGLLKSQAQFVPGPAWMFRHLTGVGIRQVVRLITTDMTVMDAVRFLGGSLRSSITIPARPFMAPALKSMSGMLRELAPPVGRAIFSTWVAKTGEKVVSREGRATMSRVAARGTAAGSGGLLAFGGIRPRSFSVLGLAGFRPSSVPRVRLGI